MDEFDHRSPLSGASPRISATYLPFVLPSEI